MSPLPAANFEIPRSGADGKGARRLGFPWAQASHPLPVDHKLQDRRANHTAALSRWR